MGVDRQADLCKYLTIMASRTKDLQDVLEGFYALKRRFSCCSDGQKGVHRLPSSQWLALSVIMREKSATVRDIREALSVTSSAATQLVNQLEKNGYVVKEPDPNDHRSQQIRLSAKAHKALAAMQSAMLVQIAEVFSALTDEEFKTYCALHKKIITAVTSPI